MNLDKEAKTIITLIEDITNIIKEKPMMKKKLMQIRSHLEKAVRLTGNGIRREWSRPVGLPIFRHEKKAPEKPVNQSSDVLADNATEAPLKKTRSKKGNGNI